MSCKWSRPPEKTNRCRPPLGSWRQRWRAVGRTPACHASLGADTRMFKSRFRWADAGHRLGQCAGAIANGRHPDNACTDSLIADDRDDCDQDMVKQQLTLKVVVKVVIFSRLQPGYFFFFVQGFHLLSREPPPAVRQLTHPASQANGASQQRNEQPRCLTKHLIAAIEKYNQAYRREEDKDHTPEKRQHFVIRLFVLSRGLNIAPQTRHHNG